MKVLEYLKNLGIIEEEHSKFVIKFEDGREYDVVEILEEFNNSIEYKGIVYKVGDKVLVKGTKRIGLYETEIVKDLFGCLLYTSDAADE